MNYFDVHNRFWSAAQRNNLKPNDVALYTFLLSEWNFSGRPDAPFQVSTTHVVATLGMTKSRLTIARAKLKEAGLIDFKAGSKKVSQPQYFIVTDPAKPIYWQDADTNPDTHSSTNSDTNSSTNSSTNSDTNSSTNSSTIYKENRDKSIEKEKKINSLFTISEEMVSPSQATVTAFSAADKKNYMGNNFSDGWKNTEDSATHVSVENPACGKVAAEIITFWNETMRGTPVKAVVKVARGSKRHNHLMARLREYSADQVREAIMKVSKSRFLKGHNSRGWTADFEWVMMPNNFPKVLEGNYDDNNNINEFNNTQSFATIRNYGSYEDKFSKRRGVDSSAVDRKSFRGTF